MEKNLKQIYELMFQKLKEISVDHGFEDVLVGRRKGFEEKKKDGDDWLFESLSYCVFVSGFGADTVETKWDAIRTAFDGFSIKRVASYGEEDADRIMQTDGIIRNERKIRAVIKNAKEMERLQQKYGGFAAYIESFNNQEELLNDMIERFCFMGPKTARDYLRDIGFNFIKPDVVVTRIMHRLGLISSAKDDENTVNDVLLVAKEISTQTNEPLGIVDAVFWFYGARDRREVKKVICGNVPLCQECPVNFCCDYYQKQRLEN